MAVFTTGALPKIGLTDVGGDAAMVVGGDCIDACVGSACGSVLGAANGKRGRVSAGPVPGAVKVGVVVAFGLVGAAGVPPVLKRKGAACGGLTAGGNGRANGDRAIGNAGGGGCCCCCC